MKTRLLLLLLLAALVTAWFTLDLGRYLNLATLQAGLADLRAWLAREPLAFITGFFLLYVLVTALSVPGAAVLTLAAGALFGLVGGTVLVSFASTLGATLATLTARYLLREPLRRRFARQFEVVDRGIARDGILYLASLRLMPVFPFFLINLLMGLTHMPVRTFFWVSQLSMLPGTLVYVNAGTQIARLRNLSDVASPGLWLSFALLAGMPWLGKLGARWLQRRRRYSGWRRPRRFDRNLVVIGGGAAGLVSAYLAAAVKARVTLVEAGKLGGDCLNTGCVPSKALIRCAKVAWQQRHARDYGIDAGDPKVDFAAVMAYVQRSIGTVEPHDSAERYTALGVEVLQGYARLIDPWTVEVALADGGRRRLTTRAIVLATGARPVVPPLPGIEETGYLTSDTLWSALAERGLPRRLAILGGGPIGCELAQALARLGAEVVQIERGPRLLPREDPEVSELARQRLAQDGVQVLTGHRAVRCERDGGRKFLVVEHDGREQRLAFDALLCAVGRAARLEGYGLETLGIDTHRTVATNDYLETLYPNIYAAGDVAGPWQFTHTAAHQAGYATVNALFGPWRRLKVDDRAVPRVTFLDPEIAHVGLTEQEAAARGIEVEVSRYDLAELDRAITEGARTGFVKVLTVPGRDRLLGATIVAERAGEMLMEFTLALQHGLGMEKLLATIHPYPTWAEADKFAAGQWKRDHAPAWVFPWLERYHRWRRGNP
ncbi:hypothetical protein MIT9_P1510 [Methylomarinovum caldicuralii]|uniref:Pyridine nucleotide-disulfide oxidoreductase n=1 Tax=Methylomarinovum caldicuralii TaxID=438856 RepID=A0AAU9C2T2_9GAMM|nr:bifunctional TVP38/TMEM64 family protein/FAD-dependent oxidoreductase [Methylomarinovum caldicuralii]BCX81928.1 hypothetical protein MIT9_P1510 [Methylomarinovum caldicuralii]